MSVGGGRTEREIHWQQNCSSLLYFRRVRCTGLWAVRVKAGPACTISDWHLSV